MPAIQRKLTKQEQEWQAQDDARVLAQANVIQGDNSRLTKASKAADQMAQEATKQAEAMKRVANKKASTPAKKSALPTTRSKRSTGTRKR